MYDVVIDMFEVNSEPRDIKKDKLKQQIDSSNLEKLRD